MAFMINLRHYGIKGSEYNSGLWDTICQGLKNLKARILSLFNNYSFFTKPTQSGSIDLRGKYSHLAIIATDDRATKINKMFQVLQKTGGLAALKAGTPYCYQSCLDKYLSATTSGDTQAEYSVNYHTNSQRLTHAEWFSLISEVEIGIINQ